MSYQNNFWRTLLGQNAEVFVGKQVQYTDDATYAAFVANAVEGEIGVFNADTLAALNGAGAATAGQPYFIANKRDGQVEKSVTFVAGAIKAYRTAYVAPAKQVSTVNTGTARASLVRGDLTFSAKALGVDGNDVTVVFVDSASNNVPLTIGVVGQAITVNLATDGASAPTSTAQQVYDALQASVAAMALVTVQITGNAATVQAAISVANLAGGTVPTALVKGDELGITIIDTTPGAQPFPTYVYNIQAKQTETWDQALARLAVLINDTASVGNRDRDLAVTATYSAADDAITLTAKDFGSTFRVQLTGKLFDFGETIYGTKANIGSGFPAQVRLLQAAGDLYRGVTTSYPLQGTVPEDYGKPTDFVSDALTYNIYAINDTGSEKSKTPHKVQNFQRNIIIAVPATGASSEEEVKAIFGL